MDNKENYTIEDINNIKQITEINGNVGTLKDDMKEVKSTLKDINNSLPAIRNDLNLSLTGMQENKIQIVRVDTESRTRDTAVELRVKALEESKSESKYQKDGVFHLWRTILAVIGFLGLVAGTILTLVNILKQLNG